MKRKKIKKAFMTLGNLCRQYDKCQDEGCPIWKISGHKCVIHENFPESWSNMDMNKVAKIIHKEMKK